MYRVEYRAYSAQPDLEREGGRNFKAWVSPCAPPCVAKGYILYISLAALDWEGEGGRRKETGNGWSILVYR